MADDSLLPYRPNPPAGQPNRLPVPPQPHPPVPIPQAPAAPGAISWGGGTASTREECWYRLGPRVHQRVQERAGHWLDWWATDQTGRVKAVVLGTHALVVVTPTVNAAGGVAHQVLSVNLDPSSFRSAPIHFPGGDTGRAGAGDAASVAAMTARLDHAFASFMRVLPASAQVLLRDPFLSNATPLQHDWYAYATGSVQSLGGAAVRVWCYLTDRRALTFCAGIGHGYVEGYGAQRWELTCWRAAVAPRQRTGTDAVVPR